MKKLISLVAALILMATTCSIAQRQVQFAKYPVYASTFIELFTYRSIKYRNDNYSILDDYTTFYSGPNKDGSISMDCGGGEITYRTSDLGITEWGTILMRPDGDVNFQRVALGISCLELPFIQDAAYESMMEFDMYENPYSWGLDVLLEYVFPKMSEASTVQEFLKGNKVKCYSGVYDYYLSGMLIDGHLTVSITAKGK